MAAPPSKVKLYHDFINTHHCTPSGETKEHTHTRIGNKEHFIRGGSYHISKDAFIFQELYYNNIILGGKKEYLTERQLSGAGPIAVDFDFKYEIDIADRPHTRDHIFDMVHLYLTEIKKIVVFKTPISFPVFIMEKPNMNCELQKNQTKDGIHMLIGLHMPHMAQLILRTNIIKKINEIWGDLPFTNSWDLILDNGISSGTTNWQLYGSRKPLHEAYELTLMYNVKLNDVSEEFDILRTQTPSDNISFELFQQLSVRYDKWEHVVLTEEIENANDKKIKTSGSSSSLSGKTNMAYLTQCDYSNIVDFSEISNEEELINAINSVFSVLRLPEDQYIVELHEYTQILPEKYYEPGSHNFNIQVAFALKSTSEVLFLSWVMLRSKACDFDYNSIPELYNRWSNFTKHSKGVTRRSIIYWARQDAYDKYILIKQKSTDYLVNETIKKPYTDFDTALVLHSMFKDTFVCANVKTKQWYIFSNHKWELEEGNKLRMAISKNLFDIYDKKLAAMINEHSTEETDDAPDDAKSKKNSKMIKKIAEICVNLKQSNLKNNIMRESLELFYDKTFIRNLDSNPYLMGFNNGVVDFSNSQCHFRPGNPYDYISLCTEVDYINTGLPETIQKYASIMSEIRTFMKQIFPQPNVNKYMWNHLAATLIGVNFEQVMHIYNGGGSNGKSALVELMSAVLGKYKGVAPITLITARRAVIGSSTSEIIKLKGLRYAVMQEPSKNMVVNDGPLKELIGDKTLQGRSLYKDCEEFTPQFHIVVTTNSMFTVNSTDDGIWRRFRKVDCIAKMASGDENYNDNTPPEYIFPKNPKLAERFPTWAPIMAGMLVEIALRTNGAIPLCDEVASATNVYRQSQDVVAAFISECVVRDQMGKLHMNVLLTQYAAWAKTSAHPLLKPKEVTEYFTTKYGQPSKKWWVGIKFVNEFEDDEEDNDIISHIVDATKK